MTVFLSAATRILAPMAGLALGVLAFAGCGDTLTLKGSVLYRERMALPADAVVIVSLLDVSRQDAAAVTLASQRIEAAGRNVPIPFELTVQRTKVERVKHMALQARIMVGNRLMYINPERVVPDPTHPNVPVEIVVRRVGDGAND
jgi:putative lipoprotein